MTEGHTGGDDYDIILCDVSLFLCAFDGVVKQIQYMVAFLHNDRRYTSGEVQLSCHPRACGAGDNV